MSSITTVSYTHLHHGAVMFGHYGKAFYEVVKFLGLDVKKIGYNQPAGVRYPTENPWGLSLIHIYGYQCITGSKEK